MLSAKKTEIIEVTPGDVSEKGIYCIRDKKSKGYLAKKSWFQSKINKGLKIKIALDSEGKQLAPSGFGTFSLLKDGKLLEDHYISRTRFENILKKEAKKDCR
jgi:hypothetical protein